MVVILDNDSRLWGKQIDGVEIVDPKTVNKYQFDRIIIAPLFVEEISKQLQSLNIDNDKIIPYYSNYTDYFGSPHQGNHNIKIGKYH